MCFMTKQNKIRLIGREMMFKWNIIKVQYSLIISNEGNSQRICNNFLTFFRRNSSLKNGQA